MTKVAIVGSRDWPKMQRYIVELRIRALSPETEIVSGGAKGIDALAAQLGRARGLVVTEFFPKQEIIDRLGFREAAYARNTEIAEYCDRAIAFCYCGSGGTLDTVKKCKRLGKSVEFYNGEPLAVYTAHTSYRGEDYLDITRLSATEGSFLAPSWSLLAPFLEKRKGSGLTSEDWKLYKVIYLEEMRQSFIKYPMQWVNLLARSSVTLVCYCRSAEQCHRSVLASEILANLGAEYKGERQETAQGRLF